MLKKGQIIEFDRKKEFKYVRPLGKGGTGDTHLFEDETTNILFAFKKYDPADLDRIEEYYNRFVDEIKILFKIAHPNIVRIYNYYLYPELKLGYLQMEYVEGFVIDKYDPAPWDKQWDEVFIDVISAFEYLEKNKILHRDIRPANFLIDASGNVKVIDFGFGKSIDASSENKNSIVLNWPVSEMPNEISQNEEYNHQTELYFVGMLFKNLLGDELNDFKFYNVIEKMIEVNPEVRAKSFKEVANMISADILNDIDFTQYEKLVYKNFADALVSHIYEFHSGVKYIYEPDEIFRGLERLIIENSLDEKVQANGKLIGCFAQGGYTYNDSIDIELNTVKEFYDLIKRHKPRKQKIIIDNIHNRFSAVPKKDEDELPF